MKVYMTLLSTDDYTNGVVYLSENLKRVGAKFPLKCLVDETISREAIGVLEKNGIEPIMKSLIDVPEIIKERNAKKGLALWNTIFQKLWVFGMTEYEKIVYLDSDIMVLQNIDELFDKPHMSCVQDSAKILNIPEWVGFTEINAGVMVIEPDKMVFDEMMQMIQRQPLKPLMGNLKDVYCDQRVIDDYYYGWKDLPHLHLPLEYNTFIYYLGRYANLKNDDIKILHFAGGPGVKFFLPNYDMKLLDSLTEEMYKYAIVYIKNLNSIKDKLTPTKLSIIIPHYMESFETIRPLFESLNCQKGIDFNELEIILTDDGGTYITDVSLSRFNNLKIKRVRNQINTGVAMNRQRGLDNAKGKYIMFVDCDDCLFSTVTIHKIFQSIRDYPEHDIYWGWYLTERTLEGTGHYTYSPSVNEVTHFHGKIYSMKFIKDAGLGFTGACKVNEDTYFQGIAFALNPKICEIREPLVIWTFNKDSLSRSNASEITFTGHIDYIYARYITLETLRGKIGTQEARNMITLNKWNGLLAQFLAIFYFDAQCPNWNSCYVNRPDLQNAIDEELYKFYKFYEKEIMTFDKDNFIMNYNTVRINNYKGADYIERETYYDFWDRIIEKHNKKEVQK